MGHTPTAAEIVKDPKWLQSDVAEAAASWCKIGFRTDWDYRHSLGAGLLCFMSSTVPQETRDGSFGNSIGVQKRKLQR